MSQLETAHISTVLGKYEDTIKIEQSLSKDVPVRKEEVVEEFNREAEIIKNSGKSARRFPQPSPQVIPYAPQVNGVSHSHFFILKGKTLDFIGTKEADMSKFKNDVSGRFFREWLKKNFELKPKDVENVVCYNDATSMREVVELLGLIG